MSLVISVNGPNHPKLPIDTIDLPGDSTKPPKRCFELSESFRLSPDEAPVEAPSSSEAEFDEGDFTDEPRIPSPKSPLTDWGYSIPGDSDRDPV